MCSLDVHRYIKHCLYRHVKPLLLLWRAVGRVGLANEVDAADRYPLAGSCTHFHVLGGYRREKTFAVREYLHEDGG